MISAVVLDWDDAVRIDSVEPEALSARLLRLSALGVDVVLIARHEADDRFGRLTEMAGRGPGRLVVRKGEPGDVAERLRHAAKENGEPETIVVVDGGEQEAISPRRLLAELDDVADGVSAFPEPVSDASWHLEVDGVDAGKERDVESWLAVGNGRTGTRGSLEEREGAVYVAGLYGTPPDQEGVPDLVKCSQWTHLAPSVIGRGVELGEGTTEQHRRVLDMRQGILFREWRQSLPSGGEWNFRSARFASLSDRKLLVMQAEAHASTGAASLAGDIPVPPGQENVEAVEARTTTSENDVVIAVKARGGGTARFFVSTSEEDGRLERFAAVDREVLHVVEDGAEAEVAAARTAGMAQVRGRHRRAWRDRWRSADVVVDGDGHAQRALRFAMYHLMCSGDPESDLASVGARGLTGPGYKGHVFWDTEVFVLPFLIWTHPPTARALLAYRHRTLPAARAKAARLGYAGALYAWESAATGDEATPSWILLSDGTRLEIHTAVQEHHISGDIAWAVWQYWQVTGDQAFLVDLGAEILLETARFWASRVSPDDDGRFHIRKVIGPDEYHESVDDNAFTNVLARWNLSTASRLCELLPTLDSQGWEALVARLGLAPSEPARWLEVAEGLVDGFNPETLLYEQFAGFFELEDVRAADLAPRPFTAELLVGVDRLPRTQVVKQADVVMLAQMLPEAFPPGAVAANYRYYEPRTCHGSSLSPAIHAAVAGRIAALDDAERYFRMAADVDLDDRMGNAAQGVHIATMGGLWQAAVIGFGGLRAEGDAIRIDPHLPREWQGLAFAVQWQGARVHVSIRADRVTLRLDGTANVAMGAGPPLPLPPGEFVAHAEGNGWTDMEPTERMG